MGKKSKFLEWKSLIGIAFSAVVYMATFLVWGGKIDTRVAFAEIAINDIRSRADRLDVAVQGLNERLARMEANMDNQTVLLREVRAALIKK